MSALDNRIPPPLLMIGVAIAMRVAASRFVGSLGVDDSIRLAATLAAILVAAVFGGPAIARFRQARTTIDPVHIDRASSLVTSGIYRYSRNPMYVALTALLVAWGLFLDHPWLLAGPVVFALYLRWFQIRPEEAAMQKRFGADYNAYRSRTRRWI